MSERAPAVRFKLLAGKWTYENLYCILKISTCKMIFVIIHYTFLTVFGIGPMVRKIVFFETKWNAKESVEINFFCC